MRALSKISFGLLLLTACRPDLGQPASVVVSPRVLAVRADPAEVKPGESVNLRVLAASPSGTVSDPTLAWSFCKTPKPLIENNIVASACVAKPGQVLAAKPGGESEGVVPQEACLLFGPETPPSAPGEPPLRPRDPDITGGFYQPVRVAIEAGEISVGLARINCNLTKASPEVAAEYREKYPLNQNPHISQLTAKVGNETIALDALPRGQEVSLTLSWDATSAESYVTYDATRDQLAPAREVLRVSWFANAGAFAHEHTGEEPSGGSHNGWRAPADAGSATVWVVLRDDRGGVDFISAGVSYR